MHTDRFVVFKFQDEWLVTYADRKQTAFATRQDAERSAFDAADSLASSGHAVSVLIIPDEAEVTTPLPDKSEHRSSLN